MSERRCTSRRQLDKIIDSWMQCELGEGHAGMHRFSWDNGQMAAHENAGQAACPDCEAAAKHANSDATTPGFFHDKCERHRTAAVAPGPREQLKDGYFEIAERERASFQPVRGAQAEAPTAASEQGKSLSKVRSCNRHSNCGKAEEELLARNPGMKSTEISPSFHCHDDECEDCFGA